MYLKFLVGFDNDLIMIDNDKQSILKDFIFLPEVHVTFQEI